ncbi:hypothetical protein FI667_g11521, partial [Globisporangium splendens]
MSSGGSMSMSSSSSSSSGSAGVVDISKLKTMTTNQDTCMWYAQKRCEQPRTCFDCLNVGIPGQEASARCVTMAEYLDFVQARNYYYPNYKYYPSTNYTYCSALDATCQLCKQKWIQDYYTVSNTPAIPFCTGEGGCVCVAYCELPNWALTVIDNQCSSSDGDGSSKKLMESAAVGIGLIVLFLLVAVSVRHLVQRIEWNHQARREQRRPLREPSGPQLSLAGWTSMREKLIETERHHIQGRAAPHITEDAPPVLIEEGEGYRPISPSELTRQRDDSR